MTDNRLKTAAGLSKAWDAAAINRTRAGSPIETFHGRRVSLHLMIQPEVAKSLLSDQILRDQGLLSRTLVVYPATNIGTRLIPERTDLLEGYKIADEELSSFSARITDLLELEPRTIENNPQELEPRVIGFENDAGALIVKFANEVEKAQATGGLLENIRGFASKVAEQAARIAGVMTIYQDENAPYISLATMANAIEVASWYLGEAKRLLDTGAVPAQIYQADLLKTWLHTKWREPFIDIRTVVNRGPGSIRDTVTARAAFQLLEKNYWLIPAEGKAMINAKEVGRAWKVVRE